jgi:hypothetical protein
MGFDADIIEGLEIRGMAQYGIPDQTIPEPTNKQIRAFDRSIVRLFDGDKPENMAARYAKAIEDAAGDEELEEAAIAAIDAELFGIVERLCGGVITAAQLEDLPKRIFGKFTQWLVKELRDPTVSSPATKPSLKVVRDGQNAS